MELQLAYAIEAFKLKHEQYSDPVLATNECVSASIQFISELHLRGITATRHDTEVKGCGHTVVRVGNTLIDWTARQFDETADWPKITEVVNDIAVGS